MAFGDPITNGTGTLVQVAATTNDIPINGGTGVSVAVGDLVIAVCGESGTTVHATSASDNLGNSYTALSSVIAANGNAREFYSRVTTAGTLTTVTISGTASGGGNCIYMAAAWSGPFISSPLDANPGGNTGDTTSPLTCPATGTLAQASELIVAYGFMGAASGSNLTAVSPQTEAVSAPSAVNDFVLSYDVVSSTASQTPSYTMTGSTIILTMCQTASYKAQTSVAHQASASFAGAGALSGSLRMRMGVGANYAGAGALTVPLRQNMAVRGTFDGLGALNANLSAIEKRIEASYQGAGVLTANIVLMVYEFPDADDADGFWTNELGGTSLFPSVDETVVNDSDYIRSSSFPTTDICRLRLSDFSATPAEPMKITVRYRRDGAGTVDLVMRLKEGTTLIAEWEYLDIGDTFITVEETLTTPQFEAITDFTNLFVEFEAN